MLRFALNDIVPTLHRARTTIKKAKAEVAERRSKLKLAQPDKSDAAGAILRMEIRQKIEAMKGSEQNKYFDSMGTIYRPKLRRRSWKCRKNSAGCRRRCVIK